MGGVRCSLAIHTGATAAIPAAARSWVCAGNSTEKSPGSGRRTSSAPNMGRPPTTVAPTAASASFTCPTVAVGVGATSNSTLDVRRPYCGCAANTEPSGAGAASTGMFATAVAVRAPDRPVRPTTSVAARAGPPAVGVAVKATENGWSKAATYRAPSASGPLSNAGDDPAAATRCSTPLSLATIICWPGARTTVGGTTPVGVTRTATGGRAAEGAGCAEEGRSTIGTVVARTATTTTTVRSRRRTRGGAMGRHPPTGVRWPTTVPAPLARGW